MSPLAGIAGRSGPGPEAWLKPDPMKRSLRVLLMINPFLQFFTLRSNPGPSLHPLFRYLLVNYGETLNNSPLL